MSFFTLSFSSIRLLHPEKGFLPYSISVEDGPNRPDIPFFLDISDARKSEDSCKVASPRLITTTAHASSIDFREAFRSAILRE